MPETNNLTNNETEELHDYYLLRGLKIVPPDDINDYFIYYPSVFSFNDGYFINCIHGSETGRISIKIMKGMNPEVGCIINVEDILDFIKIVTKTTIDKNKKTYILCCFPQQVYKKNKKIFLKNNIELINFKSKKNAFYNDYFLFKNCIAGNIVRFENDMKQNINSYMGREVDFILGSKKIDQCFEHKWEIESYIKLLKKQSDENIIYFQLKNLKK